MTPTTMTRRVICHLCNYKPEYGGSFIDSLVYLSGYCRNNLQIETFCIFPEQARDREWLKRLDSEGIPYGFIPRRRNIVSHVRYLLQNYSPLVLHTHFFLFDVAALILKCLVYRRCKVIWHYHSPPARTIRQQVKDSAKLRCLFGCFGDRCIAVGDAIYHRLEALGVSKEKRVLVRNAINTRRFISNAQSKRCAREALDIPDRHIAFLMLGYDPITKGVDIFVSAAAQAAREMKHKSVFVIIGRQETRRFVSHLPGSKQLGSALRVVDPVEDFEAILNGVDVLVSSSRKEGLPYAVLEAMASGRLILSSDIQSVRETYGRSAGVWLYPAEDVEGLCTLMKRAAQLSDAELQSIRYRNMRYVEREHSLNEWAKRIGQMYGELINV